MVKDDTLLDEKPIEEHSDIQEIEVNEITESETETSDITPEPTELESTSSYSQFTPVVKPRMRFLHVFLIFLCIFLALVLVSFICFTLINAKRTTIISGVSVHHFDVSKLEKTDALDFVNRNISQMLPEEIKLTHLDFETSIPLADLNLSVDVSSAIDQAYTVGRNGNLLENDIMILQTLFSHVEIPLTVSFDESALETKLQDISSKLPDCLIESSYYLEGDKLILTKGRTGSVLDINKTIQLIKKQLQDLNFDESIEIATTQQNPTPLDIDKIHSELYVEPKDAQFTQNPYSVYPSENGIDFALTVDEVKNMLTEEKAEYEIPLKILAPKVTTNMLGSEAFPNLLSTYTTKYSTSAKDRTTNLMLAANKINGTVLMPGEEFSYNKVVGERTIAAGYREAPIYVSGQVVDGVGGGICQITTTLYNAVVLANLEIVERSNHQFVPSYARASRDATVVYGAIDFKFKNNRDYPIKLVCSVANGNATFQVFGLKRDNDYEVQITDRVTRTTSNAIYSEAYKILKQNGQVVGTYLLSKDTYKRH